MLNNGNSNNNVNQTKLEQNEVRLSGISQIRQTASKQQPLFCHHWDGAVKTSCCNHEENTPFNIALRNADAALKHMGLDIQGGMSAQGTARIVAEDYPAELENLRNYMFLEDTKATPAQFKGMLCQYLKIVKHRATRWKKTFKSEWLTLHPSNKGVWGSRRQWACAEAISRLLAQFQVTEPGNDLHPVFAMMLNPSGGIAGPVNMSLLTGDMHNSVIVHAVLHDAYGYVNFFHNVGPGYNYLGVNSFFAGDNALTCQVQCVWHTRREMCRLGLLGNQGREVREREMVLRREELTRQHRDCAYPGCSLPTVQEIKSDYTSRRKNGCVKSVFTFFKQLFLNVYLKTWKIPATAEADCKV